MEEKKHLQIDYDESWTDELGFMTRAFSEFEKRTDATVYYGYRIRGNRIEPFYITRTNWENKRIDVTITLILKDGKKVDMSPGQILVFDGTGPNATTVQEYFRSVSANGIQWTLTKNVIIETFDFPEAPYLLKQYITSVDGLGRAIMKLQTTDFTEWGSVRADVMRGGIFFYRLTNEVIDRDLEVLYNSLKELWTSLSTNSLSPAEMKFFERRLTTIRQKIVKQITSTSFKTNYLR